MFQVIAYFRFLFASTNQHGVHSPFVYDLITKCFYNKTELAVYKKLDFYRARLLTNKTRINVTDFGAGSRLFKSPEREIAAIAKTAGITPKRAKLLARLAQYFNFDSVLELGTSLGLASSAIAFATPKTSITTLEGCPETAAVAKAQFEAYQLHNISPVVTDFSNYLNSSTRHYDLVYFDGNHQKDATLSYFNHLVKHVTNDTVFIFDDIHWSKDMEDAWAVLKNHPKVTITIDTFYWGFVFFRAEHKHKEHFVIRA